jgi:peptidoglycan/LPS O-acetylase OafA/YrhL
MLTPDAQHAAATRSTVPWLDNARTGMVFLVVALHAGGVYESSGGWSWPAPRKLSQLE